MRRSSSAALPKASIRSPMLRARVVRNLLLQSRVYIFVLLSVQAPAATLLSAGLVSLVCVVSLWLAASPAAGFSALSVIPLLPFWFGDYLQQKGRPNTVVRLAFPRAARRHVC